MKLLLRPNRAGAIAFAAAAVACAVSGAPAARAQTNALGSVVGEVRDQQSLAVPGASVKLADVATGGTRATITNEAGRYVIIDTPPGIYNITVSKPGFTSAELKLQKVDIGLTLTVDVTIQVGSFQTVIEVAANPGAALQSTTATIGTTINFSSLLSLPNLGRDASTLVELQPAVAPNGSMAGAVRDQSTFQLDGVNNTSDIDGTMNLYTVSYASNGGPTGVMPTPVESIEEFKVATAAQTADFNSSAGGQVMMVTRRGGNQWHGALYEFYFGTNVGAANKWQNNHIPSPLLGLPYTPLPSSHYNRYGASAGGPLLKELWGGKTYIFANFEAFRFAAATTYERATPSALLRLGVIQLPDATGRYQAYNLNPSPVVYNGVTYQPAVCSNGQFCDPRRLGLNPLIAKIWNQYMPLPNDPTFGDGVNTQGYLAPVSIPQKSAMLVTRLDHDFGSKWRFMAAYRYYGYTQLTTSQVDIGGALPGDRLGVPAAQTPKPQKPDSITAALTTTIRPTLTNDFRANYLRNWWQWASAGAAPQLPGLGGALEMGGESPTLSLVPYNVNTAGARQRFWDGQAQFYRDDLTLLHGNHLLQFGGLYQRNFDYFARNDNGSTAMTSPVYQIAGNSGSLPAAYIPATVPSTQYSTWTSLYNEVLGIVTQPSVIYTRDGAQLSLLPQGTPVFAQSVIPTYNLYFSDTWAAARTLTFTYGLGYALEMPPYERNGKQVSLVDSTGHLIEGQQYLDQRLQAALNGQAYDPQIGFATVRNIAGGRKYPYDPFYGEWSPRVSVAWSPSFTGGLAGSIVGDGATVIRGGYSRIYGRMNGVDLVLAPVIGTGMIQTVSCIGVTIQGACPGSSGADPVNGFRIGADGNTVPLPSASPTIPQPYLPAQIQNGVLNPSAGDVTLLDPKFRPSRSDQFIFTIQRALSSQLMFEAGYVGRIIRNEYMPVDLDFIDTRLTLNGQSLAAAWANLYNAVSSGAPVTAQPFFEAALGGSASAFCTGSPSCTAAVASKQRSAVAAGQVYTLFRNLESQSSWVPGRTLINSPLGSQATSVFLDMSSGWANYNALFISFGSRDFHGLTARSNFTWSKSLGTGTTAQSSSSVSIVDPFNFKAMYGVVNWDAKFVYNLTILYQTPFLKSHRSLGRLLGGWSIAPLFTAQSGVPLEVSVGSSGSVDCQTFGELNCSSGVTLENAAAAAPYTGGASAHYGVTPSSGPGANGNPAVVAGATGMNMFANPAAIYAEFRRPVLGQDVNQSGGGPIRGFPTWNLDLSVHKDFSVGERFGAMLMFQFTNVLNHFQPANPNLNIDVPQMWGVVTTQANNPRSMEFGLRIHF